LPVPNIDPTVINIHLTREETASEATAGRRNPSHPMNAKNISWQ
jgi:hypothetical protein